MDEEKQSYQHPEIEKKGQKRKLEEVIEEEEDELEIEEEQGTASLTWERIQVIEYEVTEQVSVLNSTFSWGVFDRAAAKRATSIIADLAKSGNFSSRSVFLA